MTGDAATGVEYIPTGKSPYYLEFRKLIQRLLLAAGRAGDLRVYADGDLSVGVRPGRCVIGNQVVVFAGVGGRALTNNAVNYVYMDGAGNVQVSGAGMPGDRWTYLPLAQVTTTGGGISELVDRRGEALLSVVDGLAMGITAPVANINQAMEGISEWVTGDALNALTEGAGSVADSQHTHIQSVVETGEESLFRLVNYGEGNAGVGLSFELPSVWGDYTALVPEAGSGWLRQRRAGLAYQMVGVVDAQFGYSGNLTADQGNKLIGAAPVSGTISNVILSVGTNIQSSQGADAVVASVKVNGSAVCTANPRMPSSAGSGFRSTGRGQGTAAVLKTDATVNVTKGDVLTVDLTRSVGGSVSVEAANVAVVVVIRAGAPE